MRGARRAEHLAREAVLDFDVEAVDEHLAHSRRHARRDGPAVGGGGLLLGHLAFDLGLDARRLVGPRARQHARVDEARAQQRGQNEEVGHRLDERDRLAAGPLGPEPRHTAAAAGGMHFTLLSSSLFHCVISSTDFVL